MPTNPSSSGAAVWAVLRKECLSEWRTRYGLNAALLFAILPQTITQAPTAGNDMVLAAVTGIAAHALLAYLRHARLSDAARPKSRSASCVIGKMKAPPTTSARIASRFPTQLAKAAESSQIAPETSWPTEPPR